jgi:RNA 3'-terminal phosphate cyclase (ATP)
LTGIQILADISDAYLKGANLKSKEIELIPKKLKSGRYVGDTHTAGSICLLMQSSIPCLLFTDNICNLDLRGGTVSFLLF